VVIARIFDKYFGISMGRSLLLLDVADLLLSLTYNDVKRMMYTLIVSFVFRPVVASLHDGAYAAKGIFIVYNQSQEIGS
ncbi:YitT family protein, partial [Enterococcus faecalis]|uniref:YitT family protein n=1 Tax=Enterococcus faecalis TaxID=1351 RepID=UPI003CC5F44D